MRTTKAKLQLMLLGINQTKIAAKANVSVAYINQCVNGKNKPSKKVVDAICELTGLSEEVLFENKEAK